MLSLREFRVCKLAYLGYSNSEIAVRLNMNSRATVAAILSSAYKILKIRNRAQLVGIFSNEENHILLTKHFYERYDIKCNYYRLQGKTNAEIAELLNLTIQQVRYYLYGTTSRLLDRGYRINKSDSCKRQGGRLLSNCARGNL